MSANYPIIRSLQNSDNTHALALAEIMMGIPNVIILLSINRLDLNFVPNTGKIVVKDRTKLTPVHFTGLWLE
jgi:hypothetical protein